MQPKRSRTAIKCSFWWHFKTVIVYHLSTKLLKFSVDTGTFPRMNHNFHNFAMYFGALASIFHGFVWFWPIRTTSTIWTIIWSNWTSWTHKLELPSKKAAGLNASRSREDNIDQLPMASVSIQSSQKFCLCYSVGRMLFQYMRYALKCLLALLYPTKYILGIL